MTETMQVTLLRRTLASFLLLCNPNALVAISNGMLGVKLCSSKIMQVVLYNGHKMVVVVVVVVVEQW